MNEKILTCAPLPPPHGGITNWYQILIRHAEKNGVIFVNVDISPKTAGNKRSLFNRIVVQGLGMLKNRKALKQVIAQHEDISCAHLVTSGAFGLVRDIAFMKVLKKKHIPSVYHIHFGRIPDILASGGSECRMLIKAVTLADTVIAIDRYTEKALSERFPDKRVVYIPNPVETEGLTCSVASHNTILYLGMVYKEKGIEELLTAWQTLKASYPDWQLTIAGACDDNYRSYLETNYSMERVTMTGFLAHDDAMKLLSESALLTLPSYTEGFPNVVVEAMMCQKAVVATAVGAIEDMLSGDCGVVIPPKDADALAAALGQLMQDDALRNDMGSRGHEKASAQYAADHVFARYREIWRQTSQQ